MGGIMSKYDRLSRYLAGSQERELGMTFSQTEKIRGFRLPKPARQYPAWWSNHAGSHAQAQAWLAAGFETEQVDIAGERVTFVLTERAAGLSEMPQPNYQPASFAGVEVEDLDGNKHVVHHPAFGSMKGTTIIMPGVDITEPADPDWGKVYDDAYYDDVIEGPRPAAPRKGESE
jgi:hypothetical protein